MKHDLELKVQAWLDGELSDHDAERIAGWVASDAEASALVAELGTVRKAMVDNELIMPLPETREFHWSKIERQIERESLAPLRAPVSWLARWRQLVVPVSGVAALACVLILAVIQLQRPNFDEISATGDGMEAVTFHDQSAGMTVVWLQDSSQTSEAAPPAKPSASDDSSSDVEME
jgi:anti-sigma factor RsiW